MNRKDLNISPHAYLCLLCDMDALMSKIDVNPRGAEVTRGELWAVQAV